jgi:CheY-like chemotaxis protein
MLREMLRTTKWPQAEFADSAASAFQQIRANVPDLVINDWQMPGESGLDLIRMIRQHRDSPDRLLPVILLTANGDAEHVIGAQGRRHRLPGQADLHDAHRRAGDQCGDPTAAVHCLGELRGAGLAAARRPAGGFWDAR